MKKLYLLIITLSFLIILSSCTKRINKPVLGSDEYIESNYLAPESINLKVPKKKRNLIHFYLESVENSFLDYENGGNLEENLMPELTKLAREVIDNGLGFNFSHKKKGKGFGGPLVTYGAEWSIASMVNQMFGFPMLTEEPRNKYGDKGAFFPGAVGIGDILAQLQYNQTVMFGASKNFGALRYLFEDHGDFKIWDWWYAKNNKYLPDPDYFVNWGYEDEKLYTYAKEELLRLSSSDKPFHFMMENADTHYPGFHFDSDGNPVFGSKKEKDYGRTIKFADKPMADFIRWCMQQDFFENTTIVVIGDHNSMDKDFFKAHDFKNYERTTFNLVINPGELIDTSNSKVYYNRKWASYDLMPTILKCLNIDFEGERLGLGTNLFSGEKTLYEKDGYNYVNGLYKKKSYYFVERFIRGKVTYDGKNLITSDEA